MLHIKRFFKEESGIWNQFVSESKNGTFLFDRNYMDYHSDRFVDHSLMFYNDDELLCVLPASQSNTVLSSHPGLSFGGFIMDRRVSVSFMIAALDQLIQYLRKNSINELIYKSVPYIYHRWPSQEDLYALMKYGAYIFRRDLGSVIDLSMKWYYTKGTKSNLSKARKNNLHIERSNDYMQFMAIVSDVLKRNHNAVPTHSADEILLLANRFPENIYLYLVYQDKTCLGGTVIYLTDRVAHTQYIGITDQGKEMGALDILLDYLIAFYSQTHKFFSFGISTSGQGKILNEGLVRNKESFGARSVVYDFYKIDIKE